jgi:Insertion element 4 transposase N-terminal
MARTIAALPAGSRITDYISLGVIAKFFPLQKIQEILQQTRRASVRERDLPAHVVVYYVIALALYMRSWYREVLRCLLEGVPWLMHPSAGIKVGGRQIGHLTSAEPARMGTREKTVCRRGGSDRGEAHARRLVSTLASGEFGRQHSGCG